MMVFYKLLLLKFIKIIVLYLHLIISIIVLNIIIKYIYLNYIQIIQLKCNTNFLNTK